MAEPRPPRARWSRNRVIPAVCAGLIAVFVVGSLALGGSEKKSSASPPNARLLALEAAERPVTVLVPACETKPSADPGAPGTTRVELPPGRGARTVLVPHCSTGTGTMPSAAYVLENDRELPPQGPGPPGVIVGSRLTLPAGSTADTVVVPPCGEKSEVKEDLILRPREGTVSAPAC